MKQFFLIIIFVFAVFGSVYFSNPEKIVKLFLYSREYKNSENRKNESCKFGDEVLVTKVIDGDTIVMETGETVRLIGVDSDEWGQACFFVAKTRLEELILNKKINLEKDVSSTDQYGRCLAYIFLEGENINVKIVKQGLAVSRFYEPDTKYKKEIVAAQNYAISQKIGCKWENLK